MSGGEQSNPAAQAEPFGQHEGGGAQFGQQGGGGEHGHGGDAGGAPVQAQSESFPCPSCGGDMVFEPDSQALKCSYCGYSESIAASNRVIAEHDFSAHAEEEADLEWSRAQSVIKCESCGAQTVLEKGRTSSFCAFCGSSHVIPADDGSPGIKPESVLPFQISQKQAQGIFSSWLGKDLLAPRNVRAMARPEKLAGIYTPSWTFDADTRSKYTAQAGKHYYETVTRRVVVNGRAQFRTERVQRTRWYPVRGAYDRFFDDVPVLASRNIPAKYAAKILSFDYGALQPYDAKYISGFASERYSVGINDGWASARARIDGEIMQGITSQVLNREFCDVVAHISASTSYGGVKYKLLLAPLWMSAFRYMNRTYSYLINGQSGRIAGSRPKSPIKIALLAAIAILLVALVAYLASPPPMARWRRP
ncbi:MAG: hypothetical protein LBJ10_05525 [Clostridiales bacterium]|nr:hypothetical protein [Clostridiales bacterium]